MPPRPLPADLAAAIASAGPRLGPLRAIEYWATVGSTNDVALARAARGAPHGTVVLAAAQTAGRGRRGRAWHSPPEAGMYLSAVLRLEAVEPLSLVTLAAGVAVAEGLRAATGLATNLKWPNDVVVGRPWRKLAGVLSEAASPGAAVEAVVVGIGVNLRAGSFPPELAHRATSVELELGREVDRGTCVAEVLAALAEVIGRLTAGRDGAASVVAWWRRLAAPGLGGVVQWTDASGPRRGVACDIDDAGALLVDTPRGRERVLSGEVVWERWERE